MSAKRAGGWCNSGREARQGITCPAVSLNEVGENGSAPLQHNEVGASISGVDFRLRLHEKGFSRTVSEAGPAACRRQIGWYREQPRPMWIRLLLYYTESEELTMYQKVSTDMNFVAREEEIVKFWRDNQVFKKSVELRKGAPAFTFFDGPPTANGKPHIGHVETRAIKDLIPRYRTMKGFDVLRKAGWDTHGLPVELEV